VPGREESRTGRPDADVEAETTRFNEMLCPMRIIYPFAWSRWGTTRRSGCSRIRRLWEALTRWL
jgi:hypothetical protein